MRLRRKTPKTVSDLGLAVHWFVERDGGLVDLTRPDEYAPLKAAVKEALDVETTEGDEEGSPR